ncbi:DgyrCDS8906 [Dimorphilus gyrociliatus]|nr:DgyrCDS8906 [Dimorphilus gyrociliatus]
MVEANGDGILDVVIGFGTGAEAFFIDPVVCDIYFNSKKPCGGGVLTLDGKTGEEIWRVYTEHEIFALNCQEDLDGDSWKDCVCGGRGATLLAFSPKRKRIIWRYNDTASLLWQSNFYTAQFVPDLNFDGTRDVLEVHGGDPFGEPGRKTRVVGRLILLDGRTGKVLQWVNVPDERESYYSPVLFQYRKEWTILFGTGGETHGGSLWYIALADLVEGRIEKAHKIYTDPYKGLMTPPVITDITNDGVKDLIFSSFNSSVLAFDGKDLTVLLWNFTAKGTESYSTPSVGYYNNDSVPDFLVKFSVGPGFPLYYSAKSVVLDGRNGKPLTKFVESEIATQSSPLTWSFEESGQDIFIFWKADCSRNGSLHYKEEFEFLKGTNVHEQSRSDFCQLKHKQTGYGELIGMSDVMKDFSVLYDSRLRFKEEHSAWVNTTKEALDYLERNKPKLPFFGDDMPHKRKRRHIGLHDAEGIQRYISSGTLAPPLQSNSIDNSIHLLFAVYWFYPAKTSVLFPKDKVCIDEGMKLEKRRFTASGKYYGMDRDGYERVITEECLKKSNKSTNIQFQKEYDPYNLHMGQTTIYRIKLTCDCKDCKTKKFEHQTWPSYMGPFTDSNTFI